MPLAVLALLAACSGSPDRDSPGGLPANPGTPATAAAPAVPTPRAPPADAEGRMDRRVANLARLRSLLGDAADAPLPGLPGADPRAGRVAFRATCQVCHGLYGRGDGPAAESLAPPPADLADPALAGVYTDALLHAVIRLGVPDTAMVDFEGQVDAPVLLAITAWVRTLPAGGT